MVVMALPGSHWPLGDVLSNLLHYYMKYSFEQGAAGGYSFELLLGGANGAVGEFTATASG
jgi:hypothetical protein